jgi:hypothetical protein
MTFQDQTNQQPPPGTPQNGVADTGNGFLTGVQPAQPRMASDWSGQQPGTTAVQEPVQQPQQRLFTAEEVEAFRQQEKDKLYGRLDEMGQQLASVLQERETEQQEKARLAQEAEDARKAKEEQEMDLRDLITKRDQEWQQRFDEAEQQRAAERAIFDKERQLAAVESYRRDRLEQEEPYIIPDLRDLVAGNTPEEVDQSIEFMKARSEAIAQNFAAAAQQSQQQVPFRGAAMPSVPPVGPLEQLPSNQPITQEFLDSMDMDTYKRHRDQLLRMTNPNRRQ